MPEPKQVTLWPEGAPAAKGDRIPDDQPTITLYSPKDTHGRQAARGMILVIPGGAYRGRAQHEGKPIAEFLTDHGFMAAVVDYRVDPYRYPVPSEDVQRAIRFARAHAQEWNIMPNKIAVLGFSAGGHCAAHVATICEPTFINPLDPVDRQSSRPNALVACYPVITTGKFISENSFHHLLDDENGQIKPSLLKKMSLEKQVTKDNPPTFIWTTFEDNGVPPENTILFAQALHACNVPCECHIFPHGRHGLGLAQQQPGAAEWPDLCVKWLKQLGF